MKASSYEKLRQRADEEGAVCHGEFSQHNILLENGRGETAVNFDKWNFDLQVADLGYFMRKILEKHGWSERAAERILNAYSARRPLDEGEIETLRLYLSYPWKYWKLANRYYGSRKIVDIRAEYGETKNNSMRSRQTGCGLLRDPSFNRAVEKSLFWAEIAIKPLVWGTFFLTRETH